MGAITLAGVLTLVGFGPGAVEGCSPLVTCLGHWETAELWGEFRRGWPPTLAGPALQ